MVLQHEDEHVQLQELSDGLTERQQQQQAAIRPLLGQYMLPAPATLGRWVGGLVRA